MMAVTCTGMVVSFLPTSVGNKRSSGVDRFQGSRHGRCPEHELLPVWVLLGLKRDAERLGLYLASFRRSARCPPVVSWPTSRWAAGAIRIAVGAATTTPMANEPSQADTRLAVNPTLTI